MKTRKEIEKLIVSGFNQYGTETAYIESRDIGVVIEILLDIREQNEEMIRTNRLIADRLLK